MTLLLEVMSFKPQPTGGENQYCSDVCDQVLLEELDSFIGDTGVKIVFWGGQVLRRESIRCVQAVFLGGGFTCSRLEAVYRLRRSKRGRRWKRDAVSCVMYVFAV